MSRVESAFLAGSMGHTLVGSRSPLGNPRGTIQAVVFFQPQKLMEMGWQWWPSNAILGNNTYSYSIIHYTFFSNSTQWVPLFSLLGRIGTVCHQCGSEVPFGKLRTVLAIRTSKNPGGPALLTRVAARSSILVHGLQPSFRWQELKDQNRLRMRSPTFFLRSWKELVANF